MVTKHNALLTGILFILLFTSACGGAPAATQPPAATEPSTQNYVPQEPAATEEPLEAPSVGLVPPATGNLTDQSALSSNPPIQSTNREPYDMFFENYGVNPSID